MDKTLEEVGFEWAKKNRNRISKEIISKYSSKLFRAKQIIFLAGSPGAGKTEFINLMLESGFDDFFIHIDLDELRKLIPGYDGANADSYQKGAIKIMESLLDKAFNQSTNIILDGTFGSKCVTEKNLRRSLAKKYNIKIYYVSFDPILAWKFTLSRELNKERKVPFFSFYNQYYNSYKNIKNAFVKYEGIELKILKKSLTKTGHSGKIYTIATHKEFLKHENEFRPSENKYLLFIKLGLITLKVKLFKRNYEQNHKEDK